MTDFLKDLKWIELDTRMMSCSSMKEVIDDLQMLRIGAYETFYNYCEKFRQRDVARLEAGGITKKRLLSIREKLQEFKKKFAFKLDDSNSPENTISLIFYKYNLPIVKSICNELQNLMDEYNGPLKDEAYLAEHDWKTKEGKQYSITISNPYVKIPELLENVEEFLQETSQITDIDLSKFQFEERFKILQTVESQIQGLNIDEKEKDILLYNWSKMFLKSLFLMHIQMKISQRDLLRKEDDTMTESEFCKIKNLQFIGGIADLICEAVDDIDQDKLKEIYQQHQDDEAGDILKPLIEEFVPYFQNLFTPTELIKHALKYDLKHDSDEKDEKRQVTNSDFLLLKHYIPTFYLKLVPFKLRDPPSESFNHLFEFCLNELQYSKDIEFGKTRRDKTKLTFRFDIDEIEGDIYTLQLQKYYICWYMVDYIRHFLNSSANYKNRPTGTYDDQLPIAFVLSLLPWYVDDDSEDARTLEKMIHETIQKEIGDFHGYYYDWTWYEYITKVVWPATEPLNMNDLRTKMDPGKTPCEEPKPGLMDELQGCCTIF